MSEISKQLFETIRYGLGKNPYYHGMYQMLGEYYLYTGNIRQAYISYRQALLYCDNDTDKNTIEKKLSDIREKGGAVPPTAVIVLSWNLKDMTAQCINSIRQTTLAEDVQIIVVDNASKDGSAEWLRQQDDLRVRFNDENAGFPKGCNQGIELADKDADIFLLNNDAVLTPNALFWLKIALYENDRVGSSGSMSNYVSNDQMIEEDFVNPADVINYAVKKNVLMENPYIPKIYLVGFALLIKRKVLDEVGSFDERFSPGNAEDVDLGLRIRMAGYENMLCKNSVILHFGSQSFEKLGSDFKNTMLRNIGKLDDKYGLSIRYYLMARKELVRFIEADRNKPVKVLELGCGAGATLAYIRAEYPNASVYGVEIVGTVAKIAASVGDVICADVEKMDFPFKDEFFDYCIMGDVLEHLHEPKDVLKKLWRHMKKDSRIILSMPNVKHWSVSVPLITKDSFKYEDAGILDRTHLKMYTKKEILSLVKNSGYVPEQVTETKINGCPDEYKKIIEELKKLDKSGNKSAYDAYQYVVCAGKADIRTDLDANKICFITAVNDEEMYARCMDHLNSLREPDNIALDAIAIRGGHSMASAYNEAMNRSDAKYKIYLHQDVMILDPDFLIKMIKIFKEYPEIGISGVAGCKKIPENGRWWDGQIRGQFIDNHEEDEEYRLYRYEFDETKPLGVEALDGLIICTQYDIPWREDLFDKWHFYDMSQCMEFIRRGYQAAVLPSAEPMVRHESGVASMKNYDDERMKFIEEYL